MNNDKLVGCVTFSIIGVIVLVVVFLTGFVLTTDYAPMDQVSLIYRGGPLDRNDFVKVVQPGKGRFFKGWLQQSYQYPSTRRDYIISERADEGDVKGADSLKVQVKDGNTIRIQAGVYFRLVQDPETLRQFHEKHGLKFQAWTDDGWRALLNEMIRQPIHDAFQEVAVNYTPIEAVSKTGKLAMRDAVSKTLQDRVDKVMKGHYFEIGEFVLKDVFPGPEIDKALQDIVVSERRIQAAENQRLAGLKVAERNLAIRQSLQGQGGIEAVLQNAIEKGEVKFWVIPTNQSFTINP